MSIHEAVHDSIIRDFGIEGLSPTEQDHVIADIGQIVFHRVMERVIEFLSPEEKNLFNEIVHDEHDDGTHLYAFLSAHIPSLTALIQEEVIKLRGESSAFLNDLV